MSNLVEPLQKLVDAELRRTSIIVGILKLLKNNPILFYTNAQTVNLFLEKIEEDKKNPLGLKWWQHFKLN